MCCSFNGCSRSYIFLFICFFTEEIEGGKIDFIVGELNYNFESEELSNYQITLTPNTSEIVNLSLESLNAIDSKYEIYYKIIEPADMTNTFVGGYIEDTQNLPSDIVEKEETNNIKAVFNNTGSETVTIELGMKAGFTHNDLTLETGEISLNQELVQKYFVYDYTGDSQTFVVPVTGLYEVQLWGASGEDTYSGNGAYVSGRISLSLNEEIFVFVGGQSTSPTVGGYNGGGISGIYNNLPGGAGGGATDVRLGNGTINSFDSLKSRIMVAAGGDGYRGNLNNGHARGLIGYGSYGESYEAYTSYGGTQTAGGAAAAILPGATASTAGSFGIGGNGGRSVESGSGYGGGGGGGYYGGGGGSGAYVGSWGGGSSFISGHDGCNAITATSTSSNIVHTGSSVHYSDYVFTNTVMVDGTGYNWTTVKGELVNMPTHDLTSTMTGNTGNGYARITLLDTN